MYSGFSSSEDESESVDSDFDNFDEHEDFADDEDYDELLSLSSIYSNFI